MANKLVGYFEDISKFQNGVYILTSSNYAYGDFLNSISGSNATKYALIAIPQGGSGSSRDYLLHLDSDTTTQFSVSSARKLKFYSGADPGWDDWTEVDMGSRTYSSFTPSNSQPEYYTQYPIRADIGINTTYLDSNNMPIYYDQLGAIADYVNIFDGDASDRQGMVNFINEVMGTPASPKRGYGSAVVTLNAPGENLTFESSNYEQTKVVYVQGNTSVVFDGN